MLTVHVVGARRKGIGYAVLLACAMWLGVPAGPAGAAVLFSNHGWTASTPSAGVTLAPDAALLSGHLRLVGTANFTSLAPIVITFTRTAGNNDFFTLDETITNNSGVAWSGFRFNLGDASGFADTAGGHPRQVHFHVGQSGGGQTYTSDKFSTIVPNTFDSPGTVMQQITFGGGTVNNGASFFANGGATPLNGLRMHAFSGITNEFTLTLTPLAAPPGVPLPPAALGGLGAVLLGLANLRYSRWYRSMRLKDEG